MDPFATARKHARRDTADTLEVSRICALPVVGLPTPEEVEAFCREEVQAKYFDAGFRLFETQVGAVLAWDLYGGGFHPIGVGWGKCVCANTEVYDVERGERRSVTELGPLSVPSLRQSDMRIDARHATAFASGTKQCVRLKLKHGQQLDLSTDHPVLTKIRGWVDVSELWHDDLVATPRVLPAPQTVNEYRDEEVILAAYLMADGCTAGEAMVFTQMPGPVEDEFLDCVIALGGAASQKTSRSSGKANEWNIRGLRPWLRSLNLNDCKAVDKRLPAKFYGLSDRQCALFLSRFWACDGWLENDRASLALANRELLEDIRHLLLRIGITARVDYKPTGKFSAWRMVISGGTNLDRFMDTLKEIPGKPWGALVTRASKAVLYEQDVRWARVESVTELGALPVYDLNVPDTHTFVANGIIVHNTLITLMIANRAFETRRSERSVLFVPSPVYSQLTEHDIPWARKRVGLRVPFILMQGRDATSRRGAAASQKRGCYIIPYSYLSTRDSEELLNLITPDLVILDEAHKVKNPKAARTRRLLRYLSKAQPRLVALSGTITSKSINDYHYLLAYALGENSPLPLDKTLAANWSFVLDVGADPSTAQVGPITPLLDWSRKHFPGERLPKGVPGFRKAYRLRLNTAPGVVATGDNEIGVSLVIENLAVDLKPYTTDPGYVRLIQLMKDVEELWRTPSGDEIEYGFHKWRHLYELTSGFYYHLRWPTPEEIVAKQHLTLDEAEAYLVAAKAHHKELQEYHVELRKWIEYSAKPKLDTPLLVGSNMAQHGARDVGDFLYGLWREAKDLEFEGMPERLSEPHRICDYKIQHAVRWARSLRDRDEGGLIWFAHDETGRWLAEELEKQGVDALWCPSESVKRGSNEVVQHKPGAKRILIVSMRGHGEGKNLQYEFYNQLFLDFPRQSGLFEQVLGRTHRNGQEADELIAHTMNTIMFDHLNTAACLVDALYIHQTTGSRQKAIYATWNPLPKIYPEDFLRERGFADVAQLDSDARRALVEKFGPIS